MRLTRKRKPQLAGGTTSSSGSSSSDSGFSLQPVEPRLLLSADPLTGLFDQSEQSQLQLGQDLADGWDELARELNGSVGSDSVYSALPTGADDQVTGDYNKPTDVFRQLLITTRHNVDSSPGEPGGSSSWSRGDIVTVDNPIFGPPTVATGLFQLTFSLAPFASSPAYIDAFHLVSRDVTTANLFGTNGVALSAGDMVFAVEHAVTLTGTDGVAVAVDPADIVLFQPDTAGDNSRGSFSILFNNPFLGSHDIDALTLVEQDTVIGDREIKAGYFLVHADEASYRQHVQLLNRASGMLSMPVIEPLIGRGSGGLSVNGFTGMELLEEDQTIGGMHLSAGTLLVADHGHMRNLTAVDFTGLSGPLTLGDAVQTVLWDMEALFDDQSYFNALAVVNDIVNINSEPTGSVVVEGAIEEDQTLTANTSALMDADGLGGFSYQWLRDGAVIDGAIDASYQLTDIDVGASIALQVSYLDGYGFAEQITAEAAMVVANVNDMPTGVLRVLGNPVSGALLTVDSTGFNDADGLGSFNYQWLRDGAAVVGATSDSYVLSDSDIAAQISVQVSYIDAQGTKEAFFSQASAPIEDGLDQATTEITGQAAEHQTLHAQTRLLNELSQPITAAAVYYQWLRDSQPVAGATGEQYTLTAADIGGEISLSARVVGPNGVSQTVISAATAPVININDAPSGDLVVVGDASEDQLLRVDASALTDADGLGSFSLQWLRDDSVVAGAQGEQYRLGDDDVGAVISVQLSYVDGQGATERVLSMATPAVENINDSPLGEVSIVGLPQPQQVLRADIQALSDADGMGNFTYQWLRDGEIITGASQAYYILAAEDLGAGLSVVVGFVDGHGQQETVTSQEITVQSKPVAQPVAIDAGQLPPINPPVSASISVAPDPASAPPTPASASASAQEATGPVVLAASGTFVPLHSQFISNLSDVSGRLLAANTINKVTWEGGAWRSQVAIVSPGEGGLRWSNGPLDPMVFTANPVLNQGFDHLRQELLDLSVQEQMLRVGSVTLSASFSVGYAAWLLRSGVLLSTAMSALPAWRMIDPLQVLVTGGKSAGSDNESLQSMVANSQQVPPSLAEQTAATAQPDVQVARQRPLR